MLLRQWRNATAMVARRDDVKMNNSLAELGGEGHSCWKGMWASRRSRKPVNQLYRNLTMTTTIESAASIKYRNIGVRRRYFLFAPPGDEKPGTGTGTGTGTGRGPRPRGINKYG